jgi:hypothetical protein
MSHVLVLLDRARRLPLPAAVAQGSLAERNPTGLKGALYSQYCACQCRRGLGPQARGRLAGQESSGWRPGPGATETALELRRDGRDFRSSSSTGRIRPGASRLKAPTDQLEVPLVLRRNHGALHGSHRCHAACSTLRAPHAASVACAPGALCFRGKWRVRGLPPSQCLCTVCCQSRDGASDVTRPGGPVQRHGDSDMPSRLGGASGTAAMVRVRQAAGASSSQSPTPSRESESGWQSRS